MELKKLNKKELNKIIKTKYHYEKDNFFIEYNNKKIRVNYFSNNTDLGMKVSVYIVDYEPYNFDYQYTNKKDTIDFLYNYLKK